MKVFLKSKKNTQKVFNKDIVRMVKCFQKEGYEIYAVGGCVRDLIIGATPHDVDFCTNARPEDIINILTKNNYSYHTSNNGLRFGTIVAHVAKKNVEITTYRKEYNNDGRHCDVDFNISLEEDLSRRDFTINAIAYDCVTDKFIDPFFGMSDIEHKVLRTVGNPKERFNEDKLRVLRAIRFAIRFNLDIEVNTLEQIYKFIEENKLDCLSSERIQNELMNILSIEKLTKENMDLLKPLLFYLFPELKKQEGYNQKSKYHCFDLWNHSRKAMMLVSESLNTFPDINISKVRLAAILHDIGKPLSMTVGDDGYNHYYNHAIVGYHLTIDYLKKLRYSKKDIEFISTLVKYHDVAFDGNNIKSIKRLIKKVGEENVESLFALILSDKKTHNMEFSTDAYINVIHGIETFKTLKKDNDLRTESDKLNIDGHDIMYKYKMDSSPEVGKILSFAAEAVDEGKIENNKKAILNYISNNYNFKKAI